jgi:hypothetical protein
MAAHLGVNSHPHLDAGDGEGGFTRRLLATAYSRFQPNVETANLPALPAASSAEASRYN